MTARVKPPLRPQTSYLLPAIPKRSLYSPTTPQMKKGLYLISLLIICLTLAFALKTISNSLTFQFYGNIHNRVNTKDKVIALTFDDEPNAMTEQILIVLKARNVKATFFVIGSQLEKNIPAGKKILAEGHELANHSYSHTDLTYRSPEYIRHEIEKTDSLIRQTGYKGDISFRPPFGKKLITLPRYLNKHHRRTITWDVAAPASEKSLDKIADHIVESTKPGSIILFHTMLDGEKASPDIISKVIADLQKKGYAFKTVSELIKYDSLGKD